MSNENVYLPGKIRDRIQDLMKANKVTQAVPFAPPVMPHSVGR